MNRKLLYISHLPLLSICGCSPTITESTPQIKTSSDWKHTTAFLDSSVSHQPITLSEQGCRQVFHWWEIFNDEQLNQLEVEAVKNSPTLQAAIHRFEEALYTVGIYESDLYPSLSLSSVATRRRVAKDLRAPSIQPGITQATATTPALPSVDITPGPKHANNLNLSMIVQYEIDLWGRLKLTKDQYKSIAEASLEDFSTIQLLLTHQIAQLYFSMRYHEQDLRLLQKVIETAETLSSLCETQYMAGLSTISPYLETKSQLQSLIAQKSEINRMKEQSEAALAVLIGKEPKELSLLHTEYSWSQATPPLEIPSKIIINRPDIRRSHKELEALQAQIGIAKTSYLPRLSLSALAGNESNKADSLFKWKNRIWSMGSSIGMLLLDAGARENELKTVQARFESQASEYINSCLNAINEVEKALSSCYAHQTSIDAFKEKQHYAQTLEQLEETKFNSGIIAYQGVLQSKIDSYTSSRNLLDAYYNFQVSSLDLIKSIGGSWEDSIDTETAVKLITKY